MQIFFVFGGGGIKAEFKSKLSLLGCVVFLIIKAFFFKWGPHLKKKAFIKIF